MHFAEYKCADAIVIVIYRHGVVSMVVGQCRKRLTAYTVWSGMVKGAIAAPLNAAYTADYLRFIVHNTNCCCRCVQ